MEQDIGNWARILEGWQWWNFLFMGIATISFLYATSGFWSWLLFTEKKAKENQNYKEAPKQYQYPTAQADGREFTQKTPKELVDMITGLTSIQASKIIKPYINSKQTIRAEVKDVDDRDDYIQVDAHTEDGTTVYFEFNKRAWKGAAEKLQRGSEIEATGYLESVAEYGVTLERCELRWYSKENDK